MSNELTTRDSLWSEAVAGHRRKVREQIVNAALELFAEKGFAVTSMSEVAERASISRATLYNYFPDLEHVIMAWVEQDSGEQQVLVEELGRLDNPVEQLRLYTLHQLNEFATLRFHFAVATLEGTGLFPNAALKIRERVEKLTSLLGEILAAGVAKGSFRSDLDLDLYIPLVRRLLSGLRLPLSRGQFDPQATAEAFMSILLHGLAAPTS